MMKIVEECAEREVERKQAEVPAMKIVEISAERKADRGQVEVPL
jgi:hypothetical protein